MARYLFVPLAEAVVFAMIMSYILSRTLIPTLCKYWLRTHEQERAAAAKPNAWQRFQRGFEARFERLRDRYQQVLTTILHHRAVFMTVFLGMAFASMLLIPFLGRNFFPEVDSGQIKLHMRGPTGLRVEDTAGLVDHIEAACATVIPSQQIASVVDNVGLPVSSINLTYGNSGTVGSSDADILISLSEDHAPTHDYVRTLREKLPQRFPGTTFSFLPADIVSQILNFGVPGPDRHPDRRPQPEEPGRREPTAGFAAPRARARGPAHPTGVQSAGAARRSRIAAARSSSGSVSTILPTTCC